MTITERRDTNEKLLADTDFGYEIIHTYCGEDQCSNEATHAYVSEYQFVMWICESCIEGYSKNIEVDEKSVEDYEMELDNLEQNPYGMG